MGRATATGRPWAISNWIVWTSYGLIECHELVVYCFASCSTARSG